MKKSIFATTGLSLLFALMLTFVFSTSGLAQDRKTTAYAILLDNTGSLRSQFAVVAALGKQLVHRTYQRGPVSLFTFLGDGPGQGTRATVTMGVEWTQDGTLLDRYLDSIYIQPGQTTLLDAIYFMTERLNAKANKDGLEHKVIIMVTDGEDRVSHFNEKKLFQTLRDSGIEVYAVGLVEELESRVGPSRKSAKERAMDFLNKVTKETGGRVIFPKARPANIDAILSELLR